jgi:hypothetical protein
MIISIGLGFFSSIFLGNLLFVTSSFKTRPNLLFVLALGSAMLAYWLLLLASIALLEKQYIVLSLGIFSLAGFYQFTKNYLINLRLRDEISKFKALMNGDKLFISIIILILLFSLLEALAPTTTEDTTSYHFRIPYDYVISRSLFYSPSLLYNMPHLTEVLVTLPFVFEISDVGAQIFYFYWAILFTCALIYLGKEIIGLKAALLATLLITSTPMFTYIKTSGMVEIALSAFILLSLLALCNAFKDIKFDIKWILISGCCAGAACSVKYYGLLWSVALISGLFFHIFYKNITKKLLILLTFIFGVILFGFPFYLKNFLFTGDPLYPKLYFLLGGINWSHEMSEALDLYSNYDKKPGGNTITDLILIPWKLTIDGEQYLNGKTGYGLVYLLFTPMLFIMWFFKKNGTYNRHSSTPISIFWIFIILSIILWFYFALHRGRHLFPMYAILSLFIAEAYLLLKTQLNLRFLRKLTCRIYQFVFIFSIVLNLGISIFFNVRFFDVALARESSTIYLQREKTEALIYEQINKKLSKNSKVLHLFGTNQYFLRAEQFYPSPFFQGWIDWTNENDLQAYYKKLKDDGFTHIIAPPAQILLERNTKISQEVYKNIVNYNFLNARLIQAYGKLIDEHKFLRQKSRSLPLGETEIILHFYELD